jgi:hypothetical protein
MLRQFLTHHRRFVRFTRARALLPEREYVREKERKKERSEVKEEDKNEEPFSLKIRKKEQTRERF